MLEPTMGTFPTDTQEAEQTLRAGTQGVQVRLCLESLKPGISQPSLGGGLSGCSARAGCILSPICIYLDLYSLSTQKPAQGSLPGREYSPDPPREGFSRFLPASRSQV